MPGPIKITPIIRLIKQTWIIIAISLIPTTRRTSKDTTHKGNIRSRDIWNGHRIILSGMIEIAILPVDVKGMRAKLLDMDGSAAIG